jgi:SAM-dependent methyltransferase
MTTATEHYAKHLGPVYLWMAGGFEAALARGEAELEALHATAAANGIAIDLGAGFGMHAIALARRGFSVVAVDSCVALLDELRARSKDLSIRIVEDDLVAVVRAWETKAELVMCMGDTLTHLEDTASVAQLVAAVASVLDTGGRFVVTFRDYSVALDAERRFIAVRSDADRILTCFLEYTESHVTVYDVLHERQAKHWPMSVSSYRKLRLRPQWVIETLEANGFAVRAETGLSGMIRLVAQRT